MRTEIRKKSGSKKKILIPIFMTLGLFWGAGAGLAGGEDWTPPPWGLKLQGLDLVVKEKNKNLRIEEDKTRAEIELQYAPAKSMKIKRGKVTAWLSSTDSSTPGRLYGYAFEGIFFGRVIFFKDRPDIFPETAPRNLKDRYPQGKIVRTYGSGSSQSFFEYRSDQLYLFSTDRGVYFYEPKTLEKVLQIEMGQIEAEGQRMEKDAKRARPESGAEQ
jgi:hypothetical protein